MGFGITYTFRRRETQIGRDGTFSFHRAQYFMPSCSLSSILGKTLSFTVFPPNTRHFFLFSLIFGLKYYICGFLPKKQNIFFFFTNFWAETPMILRLRPILHFLRQYFFFFGRKSTFSAKIPKTPLLVPGMHSPQHRLPSRPTSTGILDTDCHRNRIRHLPASSIPIAISPTLIGIRY